MFWLSNDFLLQFLRKYRVDLTSLSKFPILNSDDLLRTRMSEILNSPLVIAESNSDFGRRVFAGTPDAQRKVGLVVIRTTFPRPWQTVKASTENLGQMKYSE